MIGSTSSPHYSVVIDATTWFLLLFDPKSFQGIDERVNLQDFNRLIFF